MENYNEEVLAHYGVKGMRWGVRRYQKYDGTYTKKGVARFKKADSDYEAAKEKAQRAKVAYKSGRATSSTVSKQLVALRSSASDNRLLRLYQNGSKTPENQGFPGFYYI